MPSVRQWQRACSLSQERANRQRVEEDSPAWRVGLYLLLALCIFVAVAYVVNTLVGVL